MNSFKKNKNKIVMFITVAFFMIFSSGCSIIYFKSPKVSEIVTSIKKDTDLSSMNEGNKSKLRKTYGISYRKLEEFAFYSPKTNMEANEILILKLKDQQDMESIKEQVEERIEKQANTFKDYAPKQYELLESHILDIKGNYLILVVSKNADKIMKDINNSFK